MTPATFHEFLARPSTTQLLRAMVENNRRLDEELAAAAKREQAAQS